jgi:DNA-directed RNA polymerase specialized sigma subunit
MAPRPQRERAEQLQLELERLQREEENREMLASLSAQLSEKENQILGLVAEKVCPPSPFPCP